MVKTISTSEVQQHNHNEDLWMIIHNDVYDVTKFLSEHPGGEEVLLDNAGKNATNPFDDAEHSKDAIELLKKYKIGTLPPDEQDKVGCMWKYVLLALLGAVIIGVIIKQRS